MGQNIGTCITALMSSFGANKNAKRAAIVHLSFNIIGTAVWLTVFSLISAVLKPMILNESASYLGIAACHSIFNLLCTALLLPASSLLEKLATKLVPDKGEEEMVAKIDDRLLATPSIALERCHKLVTEMATKSLEGFQKAIAMLTGFDDKTAEEVKALEKKVDILEDTLGTYLVKLSEFQMTDAESSEVSMLLKAIGDFERISDHSVNVVEAAEELSERKIAFTEPAQKEMQAMCKAVLEILNMATETFIKNDVELAHKVEPLEQVIDLLKKRMRDSHIARLKEGGCSIEAGFVWADLITDMERISDHCSNIAVCVIETSQHHMNLHESARHIQKENPNFIKEYEFYVNKYTNDI